MNLMLVYRCLLARSSVEFTKCKVRQHPLCFFVNDLENFDILINLGFPFLAEPSGPPNTQGSLYPAM